MNLEELQVYQLSMEIGEKVWRYVMKWDYFAKNTVGNQLVRAIDSVAANLSEGFGRFHYNDKKKVFLLFKRITLWNKNLDNQSER